MFYEIEEGLIADLTGMKIRRKDDLIAIRFEREGFYHLRSFKTLEELEAYWNDLKVFLRG